MNGSGGITFLRPNFLSRTTQIAWYHNRVPKGVTMTSREMTISSSTAPPPTHLPQVFSPTLHNLQVCFWPSLKWQKHIMIWWRTTITPRRELHLSAHHHSQKKQKDSKAHEWATAEVKEERSSNRQWAIKLATSVESPPLFYHTHSSTETQLLL